MKFYFAYGSNMSVAQMRSRCPGHRKIGKAFLPGYRWIISARGYANVVRSENTGVEGMLYTISASDEVALDGYEGVSRGCYYKAMVQIQHGGMESEALIYIDPVVIEGKPQAEYVDRIATALADAELSPEYVRTNIRKFMP